MSIFDKQKEEVNFNTKRSDATYRCNLQELDSGNSSFEDSVTKLKNMKENYRLKQDHIRRKLLDSIVEKEYFSDIDGGRTEKYKPILDQKETRRMKFLSQNKILSIPRDIKQTQENSQLEKLVFKTQIKQFLNQNQEQPMIQAQNTILIQQREKSMQKKKQDLEEEKFYCKICYKSFEHDSQLLSLNCGHIYCKECLEEMVLYAIDVSGEVNKLKCPDSKCTAVLSRNVIQNLTNSEMFQKYLGFMLNYELTLDKNKKFCPSPDCHNILEKKGLGFSSKIKCNKCNNDICFDCQAVWHQGKSCRQYQNSTTVGWILKKDAQKCPKCKVLIEKNDGCIHMKCYKCQHHFCWGCGFPVGHIIHNKDIQETLVYGICIGNKYKSVSFRKLILIYLLLSFGAQFISFFLIFIGAALFWIVGPFYVFKSITDDLKGPMIKTIAIYLLIFTYPVCICLGMLSGVLFGAVYLGLAFLPLMIFHSYYLINIIRWWKQGRAYKGL
ncbi:ibr domain containing protein [Stylonychia lemnae]|uniref:RBR-type E3 ubiquitin transferase n=1 Tax=Stylonychia lemnae TaxID=5949 RepID=A0A077ZX79_STYLE|nr:ibr domain containing protein [Stylonychia lemnae]|eukprot:CDW74176.1 ibr domain containing protein [Stylonychia lemnae]